MLSDIVIRIRSLLRRHRVEDELDNELQFHFEHEVRKHLEEGMSLEDAQREARLVFGGMDQIKEECRQARGVHIVESLLQDFRHAFRSLRKSPVFAICCIVTLALGVAATTVAFSVTDSIILNPIPFKNADRLVNIYRWAKTGGGPGQPVAMLPRWREQSQIFKQVEAYRPTSVVLTGGAVPEIMDASQVTPATFQLLGVTPEIGRDFATDDAALKAVIISHDLWVRDFGSNEEIVGTTIHLTDEIFTVVGVMPAWFRFPYPKTQIWMAFDPFTATGFTPSTFINPIARLRDGIPLEQADAQVAILSRQLDDTVAKARPGTTARLNPIDRFAQNGFYAHIGKQAAERRTTLFVILGAAGLVLLAACANSANLFLSRAVSRRREMAVRAAIGGGRFRLISHIVTEAVVIAALAGSLGTMLAYWSLRSLTAIIPATLVQNTLRPFGLGGRVAVWATLASLGAGLLAVAIPTFRTFRTGAIPSLRSRLESSERGELRLRGLFITVEIAFALMLVVAAGLMARTLWTLVHVDTGWSRTGFTVVEPQFRGTRYSSPASRSNAFTQLADRLRSVPGVPAVSVSEGMPLLPGSFSWGSTQTETRDVGETYVTINHVTGDYFKVLGVPLQMGRTFESSDAVDTAIISKKLAEHLWPGENPVGKRFRMEKLIEWSTVVGVAADTQTHAYDFGLATFEIYRPFAEESRSSMRYIAVKTDSRMVDTATLRNQIHQFDSTLPSQIQTSEVIYDNTLATPIFHGSLFTAFALLTVLLAIAGVYAVVVYEVSRRTQEIGIRVALGATPRTVMMHIMRRSILLAGIGIVMGVAASIGLTRLMATMLYQTKPTDSATFVTAALVMVAVVALAGYLPARRASRIDPTVALRQD